MRISLIIIGKTIDRHLSALIDDYQHRLEHYTRFDIQVIPELKNTKHLSEAEQKQQEGEMLLRTLDSAGYVILLDERGAEKSSTQFAKDIEQWQNASFKQVSFVIGGPYGFSEAVYQRADAMLSLSKMTFSHQMIRLLFIEQLYRAMTILRGEPYHH